MAVRNEPLYRVWAAMKNRCKNPNHKNYGARGIAVCPAWEASYQVFHDWAHANGYRQGLSLDREKNELGYSPTNCRWVDATTQSRNRRSAAGSSSKYIGVYRCTTRQVWVAQITVNKQKKTLGLFENETDAATARNQYIINQGLRNFQLNKVP